MERGPNVCWYVYVTLFEYIWIYKYFVCIILNFLSFFSNGNLSLPSSFWGEDRRARVTMF